MLDVAAAYDHLRAGGSLVVRRERGLLRLTGPQRVWFLQNTISNDVESAEAGTYVESCFLDVKGKVIAHFLVGVAEDELWLDVDPPGTEPLVDWFVRYRFRTKVEIEDLSGPVHTVLGRAAEQPSDFDPARIAFAGILGTTRVADVHRPGGAGTEFPEAGEDVIEALRIQAGVARFGPDFGPATLPQEAGLTRVVSVSKGCYVGQEVIARLHFRGHVNKTVRPLVLEGVGADEVVGRRLLSEDRPVGSVTSAADIPGAGPAGIGMVRIEIPDGGRMQVEGGGTAVAGPIPEGTKTVKGPPPSSN